MKNVLIVLINDFPFNDGEHFFEEEIKYLSSKFDNVYIFSAYGKKGSEQTRFTDSNVVSFPLSCNHKKIKYILKGICSKNAIFSTHNVYGGKLLSALYVKGKNESIARKCIKIIDTLIEKESKIFIYSYWLTLGIASIVIRNHLHRVLCTDIRTVSRCHGYDIYSELHPFNYQPFQREVIKALDSVYPCSKYGKEYLINKYPEFKDKINVARLFSIDHNCKEYDTTSIKRFVTVSGFRSVKRLSLFAKAFSLVAKKRNDVMWDAFGDGPELEMVKDILMKNKVLNKVIFHGNVSNSDIYDYYLNNDVFFYVNVSSSEGISVSIMEAISFGVPVLATNVGGTPEIVDDGDGFLLDKNISSNCLAEEIEKCIFLDCKTYEHLRRKARKKWEEYFNSKTNLPKWYFELVGSNDKGEQ